eukprot:5676353-Alexandrium_andersonii.AAC.1
MLAHHWAGVSSQSILPGEVGCDLWVGLVSAVGISVVVGQCDESLTRDDRLHMKLPPGLPHRVPRRLL